MTLTLADDLPPAPRPDANGLPLCSEDDCPAYDGKRCRLTGFRPAAFCEPALVVIVGVAAAAEQTLQEVRADLASTREAHARARAAEEALAVKLASARIVLTAAGVRETEGRAPEQRALDASERISLLAADLFVARESLDHLKRCRASVCERCAVLLCKGGTDGGDEVA